MKEISRMRINGYVVFLVEISSDQLQKIQIVIMEGGVLRTSLHLSTAWDSVPIYKDDVNGFPSSMNICFMGLVHVQVV